MSTATSSAFRTAKKYNRAIVILSLQPRSLTADEDDFASRLMHLKSHLAGSVYHSIYPYMWEEYRVPEYHKEWAEKTKNEWCDEGIKSLFYEFKIDDPRFKDVVRKLLYNEGYKAMLTRTVSYLKKLESHSDYWEWRKAYADVNGLKDYGEEVKIPDPPSPHEGEKIFRSFINRLTRLMKHKARHSFTGSFSKTARSMEPIGFHGSNRIVCIVELVPNKTEKYLDDIHVLYGTPPQDFLNQWKERVGDVRIV